MSKDNASGIVSGIAEALAYSPLASKATKREIMARAEKTEAETRKIDAEIDGVRANTQLTLAEARYRDAEASKTEAQAEALRVETRAKVQEIEREEHGELPKLAAPEPKPNGEDRGEPNPESA